MRNGLWAVALGGMFVAGPLVAGEIPTLDCLIEPVMAIELSSAQNGVIDAVEVDTADKVSKGQALVLLEASIERTTVEMAREKAGREDLIRSREVQLDFAEQKKKQYDSLYRRKAISSYEKEEAQTEAKLARLALAQARNDRRLATLELKQAEASLALRTLRSPIDGVVVERYLNPGESVDDRAVLRLAQIDPLRIHIIVPNEFFGRIDTGMTAQVTAEGPGGHSYSARVTSIDRMIDAASGTFGVRLALPNPDHQILSGVRCEAAFQNTDLALH